jgi:hypothetical protein
MHYTPCCAPRRAGLSLVAAPGGGFPIQLQAQAPPPQEAVADPSLQYKNWWDEEHEKVIGGEGWAACLHLCSHMPLDSSDNAPVCGEDRAWGARASV